MQAPRDIFKVLRLLSSDIQQHHLSFERFVLPKICLVFDECTNLGDTCSFENVQRVYMSEQAFENSFEAAAETLPLFLEALILTNIKKKRTLLKVAENIPSHVIVQ